MEEACQKDSKDLLDFNYILSHINQTIYKIPYSYDTIKWKCGETYKIRLGNIYDPSKLWIVVFEKELAMFFKFMNDFYTLSDNEYQMTTEYIRRDHYCVVFTDTGFYRGVIVDIPRFHCVDPKVVVFLFDFGFTTVVTVDNLFFLHQHMYSIPRFAIRARLYGIEPSDTDTWTSAACGKLMELVQGKILLCTLAENNKYQRTVYIKIADISQYNKVQDISELLINENMAKWTSKRQSSRSKNYSTNRLISKTDYPYLFPSFQALETGLMPWMVFITEQLKCGQTSSILLKPYYSYNGVELRD